MAAVEIGERLQELISGYAYARVFSRVSAEKGSSSKDIEAMLGVKDLLGRQAKRCGAIQIPRL